MKSQFNGDDSREQFILKLMSSLTYVIDDHSQSKRRRVEIARAKDLATS